ncbi:3-hydroxyisobutyrate dehydrogenase-like beta-hydroxyacid dehydrogenase [Nocardia tenerifensis]|uniref:3-hydroxyisobutyrate dehydrogenase-like beta-hydroxyacid dehydrogenase n=1 Tax=Nocardia tenerifensis TaxID=228006 RepID=A0A318KGY3_9NOCA|nr:NAD(P)-dependent oxidoreductase [Nocardia tenerifensis]PXX71522.1 3-hydroxyisobutyrate dehydrogenase-like beta-hydroxyacid dehydrogenase [Nocardia tenerifensis]
MSEARYAEPVRVAVLGFGEAGIEFAADLVAAEADVRGFDPEVAAPHGVRQRVDDADAVRDAELVFSLTTAAEAEAALRDCLPRLRAGTLWAEANTSAPAAKARLAALAQTRGVDLVDVAIMAPVPGSGLRTPMCVSGSAAARFAAVMDALGVVVEAIHGPVGAASSRKLLRSVVYKGLAAAVVEALAGAEAAGCADWFREHMTTEFPKFDAHTMERLVRGTYTHAARRTEEMDAAAQQLADLGVRPRIATATRDALRAIADGEPRHTGEGQC